MIKQMANVDVLRMCAEHVMRTQKMGIVFANVCECMQSSKANKVQLMEDNECKNTVQRGNARFLQQIHGCSIQ